MSSQSLKNINRKNGPRLMKSSNVFIIILPIRMTSTKINILSPRESYAALLTTLAAVKLMETNVAWRRGQTSSNERSAYVKNNWRNIRWESTLTIVQLFLFHADLHHLFLSFTPSLSLSHFLSPFYWNYYIIECIEIERFYNLALEHVGIYFISATRWKVCSSLHIWKLKVARYRVRIVLDSPFDRNGCDISRSSVLSSMTAQTGAIYVL